MPDIMGVVETKLKCQLPPGGVGEGLYNNWFKNREDKQGGGVMILIKILKLTKVTYGENSAELITTIKVKDKDMEKENL